jgi:uncharacterized protein (DUF342 family)
MSAFASVSAGSREDATGLDAALKAARIVHGIERVACATLVRALGGEKASVEVQIARGTPAGASRAGRFEPAFQPGLQPGHVREDGTMDFHDRELLKPVSLGQSLGHLYPPVEGTPGVRVDGALVPAVPARAFALKLGPGTQLLADGRILATCTGAVIYSEGRSIEVGTNYEHKGGIDVRSGDLSMEGSLVVRGDVQHGFWVRATGDLEIKGGVEGGSAYAGANLKVSGGVRGGVGSMISAGGDLHARYVERARLDSGGVLELTSAVNSDLSAVHIHIERSLRGGRAAVEVSLVTHDAGTPTANVETVIEAAAPREPAVDDARNALHAAKALRLTGRRGPGPRSGPSDRPKGCKLGRDTVDVRRSELARKVARAERISALLPQAFIAVTGTAHAGVRVCIGEAWLLLQEPERNVRFALDIERGAIRKERGTK